MIRFLQIFHPRLDRHRLEARVARGLSYTTALLLAFALGAAVALSSNAF